MQLDRLHLAQRVDGGRLRRRPNPVERHRRLVRPREAVPLYPDDQQRPLASATSLEQEQLWMRRYLDLVHALHIGELAS
jgi:hypothetical protein